MRKLTLFVACIAANVTMLAQNSIEVRTMTINDKENKVTFDVPDVSEVTFGTRRLYQVAVSGQDNGEVTGEGYYALGSKVKLIATPSAGYRFVKWTIGEEIFHVPTITIEVKEENAITVEFVEEASFDTFNGHAYVDLGLSVLWATYNVGVDANALETLEGEEYATELFGDYYAWGETDTKSRYWWKTYKYGISSELLTKYNQTEDYGYNEYTDDKTTLDPEDDVAQVRWGGNWRMPTQAEWEELFNNENCTCELTKNEENVFGLKITSKKLGYEGKVLFLPAAGHYNSLDLDYANDFGFYWSSSLNIIDASGGWGALGVLFYDQEYNTDYIGGRCDGIPVRPVCEREE